MNQIIEGIDNEISFIFIFITLLLAVVVPLYVLRPARQLVQNNSTVEQREHVENTSASSLNNDDRATHTQNLQPEVSCSTPQNEPPDPQGVNQSTNDNNAGTDDMINIRVMHHENSQQLAVSKDMQLKDLKQKCFPTEYAAGRTIRLIYSGRVLNGETYPLRYLGIMNGSVLHSVISDQPQQDGRSDEPATISNDLDLSEYFLPFVSVFIFGSWTLIFSYSSFFSATSITILGFFTALFIVCTVLY